MRIHFRKIQVRSKRGVFAEQFIQHHPYLTYGIMFFIVPAAILLSVSAISVLFAFVLGLI